MDTAFAPISAMSRQKWHGSRATPPSPCRSLRYQNDHLKLTKGLDVHTRLDACTRQAQHEVRSAELFKPSGNS